MNIKIAKLGYFKNIKTLKTNNVDLLLITWRKFCDLLFSKKTKIN